VFQGGHVIHCIKGKSDKVKTGKPQHSQSGSKFRQGIQQRHGYLKQQDRRMELTLLILACHPPWLDLPVSHRHATRANPRYNGVSIQRLTQHRDSAADQEQHQQQERRAGSAGDGSIALSPKAINHDTHGRVNTKCATAEHRGHDSHGYQTTHGAKATAGRTDARAD
jgi:hypothetical protein